MISKMPHMKLSASETAPEGYGSIVGMWKNSVVVNSQIIATGIATWHSDGMEFDNVDIPPIVGNICEGVWDMPSKASVTDSPSRHHSPTSAV